MPDYLDLRTAAEMFEDVQKTRISQENRVRSATVGAVDYNPVIANLRQTEDLLSKRLVALYKQVAPSGVVEWQQSTLGVGPHLLARLLGHLGHPRMAEPKFWAESIDGEHGDDENPKRAVQDGEPFERMVSQLWQYCGHGEALRRTKGMSQQDAFRLGNPRCKMLVHVISGAVVKAQVRKDGEDRIGLAPLGEFYLSEKVRYRERAHAGPCSGGYVAAGPAKVVFAKCKIGDRYADAGDPYSPGHVNSIALRHLGKRVLKELWEAAAVARHECT
jgi:hypothetical protein